VFGASDATQRPIVSPPSAAELVVPLMTAVSETRSDSTTGLPLGGRARPAWTSSRGMPERVRRLHSMLELPGGTVTLLLADIEGSTDLAGRAGPEYPALLGEIRGILRAQVDAHSGVEVNATGDEVLVAFADAHAALAAALDAQRALRDHPWPPSLPVRVRMGIHTGTPIADEDGYTGLDVHRVARIASAGHGGQILLSSSTAALAGGGMTRDLGTHHLAGLPAPERVLQVVVDDLPSEFPPLRNTVGTLGAAMRVVIADDSVLLREGVARLLEESGFEVVAQSGTADDLLRHVPLHRPAVAIVDIRMPPTHTDEGLRAAKTIRERWPATGVLVLSQYVEPGYAMDLLAENAEGVGYLLKDRVADLDQFASAVRRVGEGGSALDPAVVSQLVGRRRRDDPLDTLTPREREVLELMAEGRSNQAVAERMFVTLRAVEKHVTSIFTKLGLPASTDDHRRVLAVLTYLRES
jgi:DNA-binding NarL/FixJ family response regulator/class 3 adenylate cyclase